MTLSPWLTPGSLDPQWPSVLIGSAEGDRAFALGGRLLENEAPF